MAPCASRRDLFLHTVLVGTPCSTLSEGLRSFCSILAPHRTTPHRNCKSMAANAEFDTEMAKLFALNKVNLEIWSRLKAFAAPTTPSLPFVPLHRNYYGNSHVGWCVTCNSVPSLLLHDGRSCSCMTYHHEATSTPPNAFVCNTICSVSFRNHTITVQEQQTRTNMKSLAPFFPSSLNIFNDTLPSDHYFDLSNIIKKYEMLVPAKAMKFITQWKHALEEVQVVLGDLESVLMDSQSLNEQVRDIFQMPPNVSVQELKETQAGLRGNITLTVTKETLGSVVAFAQLIALHYDPPQIQKTKAKHQARKK